MTPRHRILLTVALTGALCYPRGVVAQDYYAGGVNAKAISGSITLDMTSGNAFRRQMSTPANPSLATNQSGTDLAAATYQVAIVGVDPAGGTSLPSANISQVVGAGGLGRIIVTYVAPTGFASVRVYVTTAGGATPDRYFTSTSATTYNFDTLTGATVAALPATNTAYRMNIGGETSNWLGLPLLFPDGSATAPSMTFRSSPTDGFWLNSADVNRINVTLNGVTRFQFSSGGLRFRAAQQLEWSNGDVVGGNPDLYLTRESAATIQLGLDAAGVTDQTFKGPDRSTSDGVGGNLTIAGGRNRGASVGGSVIFQTSPTADAGVTGTLVTRLVVDTAGNIGLGASAVTFMSVTAPTIASGGCTSPAITNANGTAKFRVTIGTSCTGVKTVTLTLPATANAWQCDVTDNTSPITYVVATSSASTTAVLLSNILRATGAAADFVDGEVLLVKCMGG